LLHHGLSNVAADGILEGAHEVSFEVRYQLFLDVRPVDSGIGVGWREVDLGFCDVDHGANTVFEEVQVANHLDGVGCVRGPMIVTLAIRWRDDGVEFSGQAQQAEFDFGDAALVGLDHLHERNLSQVVLGVVEIEVFQLETEAVGKITDNR